MAIKEFAFSTQQHIQTTTGFIFKRVHVYELLAASFGYKSFAAFRSDGLLTNAGIGTASSRITAELIGRAVQLGYLQTMAPAIAQSLTEHANARQVSFISWQDLIAVTHSNARPEGVFHPDVRPESDEDEFDDGDADLDDDQQGDYSSKTSVEQQASKLRVSNVLMEELEHAAADNNAEAHFAIAALNRCKEPNSYLYEESLKGRVLNKTEKDWVEAYVQNKPRFMKYQHHLRQAAMHGVRHAATEYSAVFNDPRYFDLAERGTGAIDAQHMAKIADSRNDKESRRKWLRVAAEEGSIAAIESLAQDGDVWALRNQAKNGDVHAIRALAEMAMEKNLVEAWHWVYVAKMLGVDLTASTMRAYHDGGQQDGQEYDDDYGGALDADGDEGLKLKELKPVQKRVARNLARSFFNKILRATS
jgi:hypothetical protein